MVVNESKVFKEKYATRKTSPSEGFSRFFIVIRLNKNIKKLSTIGNKDFSAGFNKCSLQLKNIVGGAPNSTLNTMCIYHVYSIFYL